MTTLTNAEYDNEIEKLAAGIWEEALTQAEGDKEEAEQLAYALTHEWVDGHQWIIYYSCYKEDSNEYLYYQRKINKLKLSIMTSLMAIIQSSLSI